MNENATKNKLKVVSLKFSSISRISLTQTFSFILFLASKRVRVNISVSRRFVRKTFCQDRLRRFSGPSYGWSEVVMGGIFYDIYDICMIYK